jgi:prepilin-type N-terminal cleavage/methylation domain-containing protein/prepilin-type processing-associated H-X9-DG protein
MKPHSRPTETKYGFTLIEFVVVVLLLAILALMFLPRLQRAQPNHRLHCINNLKQVGHAYHQWALDNEYRFPMQISLTNGGTMELVERGDVYPHFLVMSNELNTPKVLLCPADEKRKATTSFATGLANSNINYFVGLDAEESVPQMLLSGDDCLSIGGKPVKSGILMLQTNASVAWAKARHNRQGNVGLADGSVMGIDTLGLQRVLANGVVATNRLAIP